MTPDDGGDHARDAGAETGAGPEAPREQFSWGRVAAELAAAEAADEDGATPGSGTDPGAWDAVAAALAASLGVPAGTPAPGPTTGPEPGPDLRGVPAGTSERGPTADLDTGPDVAGVSAGTPRDPRPQLEDLPLRPLDETPVEEVDPAARRAVVSVVPDEVDPAELRGGLEALLFVVDTPVDEDTLAATLRCTLGQARDALAVLGSDYDARRAGVVLRRVGEGWRLYTREDHAAAVERYLTDGRRSRLTQAALETLAVIAYRQPVTRARVSAIRGVGVDAVVRTLASRGLVFECGTDPDSGGGLYATTPLFLERLGLTGLDELPELAPLLPEARTVLDEHPDS